ncbi:hypothetical protein [Yoonia sp.]|uniref:hypothetical protein n=1 Tax=Yoonia sp. TaxID=2212373 RepID=UPI00329685F7
METNYRFCDIKLQVLQLITQTPGPVAARDLAFTLILNSKPDHQTGKIRVSDSEIANELGLALNTVVARIKSLQRYGVFNIKRGRGVRKTEYTICPEIWGRAAAQREQESFRSKNPGYQKDGIYSSKRYGEQPTKNNGVPSYKKENREQAQIAAPVDLKKRNLSGFQLQQLRQLLSQLDISRQDQELLLKSDDGYWAPVEPGARFSRSQLLELRAAYQKLLEP